MKKTTIDFYGAKVTIEYEGDENPLDFLNRRMAEVKAYAAREKSKANAYARIARLLAKTGFDKPSQGSRETEAAFKKRQERWAVANNKVVDATQSNPEAIAFAKARAAQIAALDYLDLAMSNTYPDLDLSIIYGANGRGIPTIPVPWYSKVDKTSQYAKHHSFDLDSALESKFKFEADPE